MPILKLTKPPLTVLRDRIRHAGANVRQLIAFVKRLTKAAPR